MALLQDPKKLKLLRLKLRSASKEAEHVAEQIAMQVS